MGSRLGRQVIHLDLCDVTVAALDAWIEAQPEKNLLSHEEAARRLLSERLAEATPESERLESSCTTAASSVSCA